MVKGSPGPSHFIFEINVGEGQIRHKTTLNFNDVIFNRFWDDRDKRFMSYIKLQIRYISDPTFSDIDFQK